MIDHNHFICHFIFGGHLLNIPLKGAWPGFLFSGPALRRCSVRGFWGREYDFTRKPDSSGSLRSVVPALRAGTWQLPISPWASSS